VFVWDAPAHDASRPFSLDFKLEDKAQWLKEILEKEGIDKPVIVGQSMGGYVGQMFSQLFPERLYGFVSIDSAPLQRKYVTAAELWLLKRTEPIYRLYPWKALLRDGSEGVAETEYGKGLMRDIMMVYDGNPREYVKLVAHGYRILAEAMEADLPYEIKCPVILICGRQDKAGSTKRYNKTWHENTGFPIKWIDGAGHNSNTDKPVLINALLEKFMQSLEGEKK